MTTTMPQLRPAGLLQSQVKLDQPHLQAMNSEESDNPLKPSQLILNKKMTKLSELYFQTSTIS